MPTAAPDGPTTAAGRAGLASVTADPSRVLLASDYDGTLAPIVDDPRQARPEPGAVDVLARLAGLLGTVAVVTGRPADDVIELGGLGLVPGLVVLGAYGAERRPRPGGEAHVGRPDLEPAALDAVGTVVREVGPPDARIEVKGAAVAVHLRGCPDPTGAQAALLGPLREVAQTYGLVVEPGRLVVELRPPGADKGAALLGLAEERGAASVVFVGDDLGDLAAFAAVDEWRSRGGDGLKVASGSLEAPEVAEAADLVVDGPAGAVAFLEGLVAALTDRDQSGSRGR